MDSNLTLDQHILCTYPSYWGVTTLRLYTNSVYLFCSVCDSRTLETNLLHDVYNSIITKETRWLWGGTLSTYQTHANNTNRWGVDLMKQNLHWFILTCSNYYTETYSSCEATILCLLINFCPEIKYTLSCMPPQATPPPPPNKMPLQMKNTSNQ